MSLGQKWVEELHRQNIPPQNSFVGSISNPNRNRYTDVPAFENTRVKINYTIPAEYDTPPDTGTTKRKAQFMGLLGGNPLKQTCARDSKFDDESERFEQRHKPSDYINANFVSGYKPCGKSWCKDNYIAAQGPMPETVRKLNRILPDCLVNFR